MPATPAVSSSSPVSGILEEASSLLSDDGVRVIQVLHTQLQRVSWELRDAECVAERRLLAAEEKHSQYDEAISRHQEADRKLRCLQREHEEDLKHRRLLSDHLEMTQEELTQARAKQAHMVPGEAVVALHEELRRLRTQLVEAEDEGHDLKARIAEAECASRRKMTRKATMIVEADANRQGPGHMRGARMAEAKFLSTRAVYDQKDKDAKLQAEKFSQLSEQKEHLDHEFHTLYKQNVSLEQRMDVLRGRNRQLEAQHRRQSTVDEEHEAKLHQQLRKQAQQLKVLSDIFRLPPEPVVHSDREDFLTFAASGGASTAGSPYGSASASTWASTSASQRLFASARSLIRSSGTISEPGAALVHERGAVQASRASGAIGEPGGSVIQASEAGTSPPLSQAAAMTIGDKRNVSSSAAAAANIAASPGSAGTAGTTPAGDSATFLSTPASVGGGEMEKELGLAATTQMEASILRTQSLLSEVQSWCDHGGEEVPTSFLPC